MSSKSLPRCLFLDTSVIFSEILKEELNQERLEKFKQDTLRSKAPCCVSDSVVKECEGKIDYTNQFLLDTFEKLMIFYLEQKRKTVGLDPSAPLTESDIETLERLFLDIHRLKSGEQPLAYRKLECWIVHFLEEKTKGSKVIDLHNLTAEMVSWSLQYISELRMSLDNAIKIRSELAREIQITPQLSIIEDLENIGLGKKDATHVAAAATAQMLGKFEKVIFVTLDYRTIIEWQEAILRVANVICTDPLYAAYHFRKT